MSLGQPLHIFHLNGYSYTSERHLGNGAFGHVWQYSRVKPGGSVEQVAIKFVDLRAIKKSARTKLIKEIDILRTLAVHHPDHVVLLLDAMVCACRLLTRSYIL